MITSHAAAGPRLEQHAGFVTAERLRTACWIDLMEPTTEEEQHVEALLGLDLPTRDEMREIEDSNRLYEANGALFLTATVMVHSDAEYPRAGEITFVLTPRHLVTVRYAAPKAFRLFAGRAERHPALCATAESALLGLLEALLERIADNIEKVAQDLDDLVHAVLAPDEHAGGRRRRLDYAAMLRQLERAQAIIAKARASLTSLNRLLSFLTRPGLEFELSKALRSRIVVLIHDAHSLMDHAGFLANNISFELAAILGMVNIEQNGIIKIFSVAAVVFLPPTLVASVYGMNFEFMPELRLHLGYPLALGAMLLSAVLPYLFFKRKGWL